MATLLQQIRSELEGSAGVSGSLVTPEAQFARDLGLDSLDLVGFFEDLEYEFSSSRRPLEIGDDVSEHLITVRDLMDYLSTQLSLLFHPQFLLGRIRWRVKMLGGSKLDQ